MRTTSCACSCTPTRCSPPAGRRPGTGCVPGFPIRVVGRSSSSGATRWSRQILGPGSSPLILPFTTPLDPPPTGPPRVSRVIRSWRCGSVRSPSSCSIRLPRGIYSWVIWRPIRRFMPWRPRYRRSIPSWCTWNSTTSATPLCRCRRARTSRPAGWRSCPTGRAWRRPFPGGTGPAGTPGSPPSPSRPGVPAPRWNASSG